MFPFGTATPNEKRQIVEGIIVTVSWWQFGDIRRQGSGARFGSFQSLAFGRLRRSASISTCAARQPAHRSSDRAHRQAYPSSDAAPFRAQTPRHEDAG